MTVADLTHAERTLLIKRDAAGFPDGCHQRVHAALVRANYTRQPHSWRFLDAKGREVNRSGVALTDFDLEPLFDAGAPDDFVLDGRFAQLIAALDREDIFVDRNAGAALVDKRADYARWRGGAWSAEIGALLDALSINPKRRFTGWSPATGRLQRARDGRSWMSPLHYMADGARELIHQGVLIGHLTRPDTYRFAPTSRAHLMVDGPSGVVVAFTEDGQIAGRSTLGALAFGSGLLTAFEARRVSWLTLKRVAAAWKSRFRVGWYAPKAHWASRGSQHLLDFQGLDRAPSPTEAAANWLAVVSSSRVPPEAVPLPDFDVEAIESADARLVANMVRAFWIGDDAGLAAGSEAAAASKSEALKSVAQALTAATAADGRFGYLFDTAERRANLIARWRAAQAG